MSDLDYRERRPPGVMVSVAKTTWEVVDVTTVEVNVDSETSAPRPELVSAELNRLDAPSRDSIVQGFTRAWMLDPLLPAVHAIEGVHASEWQQGSLGDPSHRSLRVYGVTDADAAIPDMRV